MVKRFLLAGFLLVSLHAAAQYKPIIFGLRAGGSMDWMKPDAEGYAGEGVRLGFSWGFVADFFLMENYAIQSGFNVQYLKGKLSYPAVYPRELDTLTGTLLRRYNLQYIQIPLALKMQAELSETVKLFGKIGLGTAFRLRAKAEDTFTSDGGLVIDTKEDISGHVSLIRESFLIGGGATFTLNGSTAIIIDLTFDNGFLDILKGSNSFDPDTEHKAVLNFVELGVGIVF